MICGIILYHPNIEVLQKNIKLLQSHDIKILLFQNSIIHPIQFQDCILLGDGTNKGIGFALNSFVKYCKDDQIILFLDQDTILNDYNLKQYKEVINSSPQFDILNPQYSIEQNNYKYFTSGSVNRIDFIKTVGGFRDDLFIDEVDGDFYYRAINLDANIIFARQIVLDHPLGEKISKVIFGRRLTSDNHDCIRKYYISRNRTYLATRFPKRSMIYLKDSFIKVILLLLVENNRTEKLKFVFKGILHGLVGRLGKYD